MNSCTPVILVTFLSNFVKEYSILYRTCGLVSKTQYAERTLHEIENTRKYPLRGYILGVLTHTTAWDRHWEGDITLLG